MTEKNHLTILIHSETALLSVDLRCAADDPALALFSLAKQKFKYKKYKLFNVN